MGGSSKGFYGFIVVLALACLGYGMKTAGATGACFGLFAFLTVGGGLLCVWERSVVRSAFALMATFLGTAGLFLLLGADFLAMSQILIYVGGILALILFGVMLTPPDLTERKLPRVVGGLVLAGGGVAWVAAKVAATATWAKADSLPEPHSRAEAIGIAFLAPDQYVVPFELAAVLLTVALVAAVYVARRRKIDFDEPADAGVDA